MMNKTTSSFIVVNGSLAYEMLVIAGLVCDDNSRKYRFGATRRVYYYGRC